MTCGELMLVIGYVAAVALAVLAIRRVDRGAGRTSRLTRLMDQDEDCR